MSAIEQAARIALPDAERIEDARAQVEQRLAGAGGGDPAGLLAQLAAVGGALAGAPGPKLESLGWRERTLELQIVAANTDAIARFAQGINARGLSADVASTTNSDKGIEAQVKISPREPRHEAPGLVPRACPSANSGSPCGAARRQACCSSSWLAWWLGASVASAESACRAPPPGPRLHRDRDAAVAGRCPSAVRTNRSRSPSTAWRAKADSPIRWPPSSRRRTAPCARVSRAPRSTRSSLLLARLQKERGVEAETASVTASGRAGPRRRHARHSRSLTAVKRGAFIAAGVAAFLVCLVAMMPAQQLASRLPAGVELGGVDGTIWSGKARSLAVNGRPLGALDWSCRPWPLLVLEWSCTVSLAPAGRRSCRRPLR